MPRSIAITQPRRHNNPDESMSSRSVTHAASYQVAVRTARLDHAASRAALAPLADALSPGRLGTLILLFGALTVIAAGCCQTSQGELQINVERRQVNQDTPEPPAPPDNPVVAQVDGDPVYLSEVEQRMERAMRLRAQIGHPPSQRWLHKKRRQLLHDIIERRLLRKAILELDERISEDAVDARLNERISTTFRSRASFLRHLQRVGQSEAEYREGLRDELAVERLSDDPSLFVVDEEAARGYYARRRQSFKARARVRMAVIVLKRRSRMNAREIAALEERAQNLTMQARNGADFHQLARRHSNGPTADQGGDLGWVYAGNLDKRIAAEAFKMPVGEVSEPIATRINYQIIKIKDRRAEGYRGYDEVRHAIRKQLLNRKRREARHQVLIDLKRHTTVKLHEEHLNSPGSL